MCRGGRGVWVEDCGCLTTAAAAAGGDDGGCWKRCKREGDGLEECCCDYWWGGVDEFVVVIVVVSTECVVDDFAQANFGDWFGALPHLCGIGFGSFIQVRSGTCGVQGIKLGSTLLWF